MASNNNILILPETPVFNQEGIIAFDSFTLEDSALLYSTLYSNYIDILANFSDNVSSSFLFDSSDRGYIPEELKNIEDASIYFDKADKWKLVSSIASKILAQESANLIIFFANSIGVSPSKIQSVFNLLNNDDNNLVAGFSNQDQIAFCGFNQYNDLLFSDMSLNGLSRDSFYKTVNKYDNYLFPLEGFYTIENLEDFRLLYKLLSTKESIEYCSHEIHEQFTNLFIEYKELL